MDPAGAPLFDSDFLAKLEQLHLLARRLFRGEQRAERRSRQLGASLEFADYREYAPGDELRNIDWPAFGRLERLFVKLYEQEQDLPVSFLVDTSASMRWQPRGRAGRTKLDQARRITAALSYIALANLDAVNIHCFADALGRELGVSRGRSQFHGVLAFLRGEPPRDGRTSMLASLRAFTQRVKRSGLAFVLSDFFDPAGYAEALSLLRHAHFQVHVIQVLDPAELAPEETGDLRLREAETGSLLEITATDSLLRAYRREIESFNAALETFCHRHGCGCAQVLSDVPFQDVVLRVLRDGVLLK